ncbi:MAG: DUF2949 domain-containing protein [Gomphosphaeria aponina SAG 52.96 = DSM 107014]|uniref:DUF2949 domain-containing protein n=1 Tax=Gomphosphaeria aponina SAG 52.96 = DSM 107014 TaxID=1521640 RepID=A0A941GV54_9CHRO|nr:DUF2949 domain-containing protein [Gomphosphaeria aponina SAG 52.96 = DSM 107014]
MQPITYSRFIQFLQEELSLSNNSIAMAEKAVADNHCVLPMVLWQYGLVTLEELDKIYDWLETA